jgi:outer membrane protein
MMRFHGITIINLLIALTATAYAQTAELSLSAAIEKALESNYGIMVSRSEAEIATINNHWGTAGRYPTVGFDATALTAFSESGNSLSASVGLNWILFDGFRVKITKNILETTEALASGKLGIQVENTIEDVVLGYYGVLLEEERLKVLKTVMDLSSDRYNYEKQRRSLGSTVTYEVLQAENVYLSDKAAYLDQEMRVRNARRNFNFLLAAEPVKVWDFTAPFVADTAHYTLDNLREKMTSNNQALKNQYTNLLLKEEDSRLRESDFYPSVSAGLGTTIASSVAPYGNLRLSYDIYNGGKRRRALQIARIGEEIARVETEQMEHALTNELFNLYDYHEVRIELLHVADKSLAAADLNLQMSEERYRSGVINSFNYRDVQLIYLEASLRRLQAIYNLIDSKTKLTRIIGGYLQVGEN